MLERPKAFKRLSASYLFAEIERRKRVYQEQNPGVELLNLGIGDTVLPLPPPVVSALVAGARDLGTLEGYSGYGNVQGSLRLRSLICERFYPQLSPDELFISDGAKSDLGRLQNFFGGDLRVGMEDPTYPVYLDGSLLQGVQTILPLPCHSQNHFFPDLPEGIDLLYFCNPNNPTGRACTKEQLSKLVDYALSQKVLLIYDGAYASFIQDPLLPRTIYEIPGAEKVAIEVNSFSKMAGFSGLRLGWTVIPKELRFQSGHSIRDDFLRFGSSIFNGASNLIQQGGLAVLSEAGWQGVQASITYTLENGALLKDHFEKKGYRVHGGINAPYLWIETPGRSSWDLFQEMMEKDHVIVTPGVGYGPTGEGAIRISAFGHREKLLKFIERS